MYSSLNWSIEMAILKGLLGVALLSVSALASAETYSLACFSGGVESSPIVQRHIPPHVLEYLKNKYDVRGCFPISGWSWSGSRDFSDPAQIGAASFKGVSILKPVDEVSSDLFLAMMIPPSPLSVGLMTFTHYSSGGYHTKPSLEVKLQETYVTSVDARTDAEAQIDSKETAVLMPRRFTAIVNVLARDSDTVLSTKQSCYDFAMHSGC
jgi:hypothetical protein